MSFRALPMLLCSGQRLGCTARSHSYRSNEHRAFGLRVTTLQRIVRVAVRLWGAPRRFFAAAEESHRITLALQAQGNRTGAQETISSLIARRCPAVQPPAPPLWRRRNHLFHSSEWEQVRLRPEVLKLWIHSIHPSADFDVVRASSS